MNPVDEIKARIDIVDLVSDTVQLRRSGKTYTGFCPFHSNTRTPAFVVWPETGTWRCFGQCNEGGDVFNFVMKKEGWDFSEALHYLADKAGVELTPQTPEQQAAEEEYENLRRLLEDAVTFFRHLLHNSEPGRQALKYLVEKRGLTEATIEAFGLGYAPAGWDNLINHFRTRGYADDELVAAGLVSEKLNEDGRRVSIYDRFRHRVMFPIRDERGRMAGFGARVLNPEEMPKFLNSPQTAVFDKSGLLYGLDRARKPIRQTDQAVIVEGYLDVIALHQAGFANAVSPMGTALSPHQLNLLKRFTRRIVLALDPDAAGDKATLRGLQVARETLDREADPVFDARGLVTHEARLKADIRVTTLPDGMDPDDVVNRDPQEWERIIESAKPVVIHVMETLAAGRDLEDPKVKSEVAAQVLPLIEDVPDPIERDTYRQRLARLIRVDERALFQSMGPARARPPRPRPEPARPAAGTEPRGARLEIQPGSAAIYGLEAHCLGLLLRRPDLLYKIDRHLQEQGLGRLVGDDFQYADHQAIFALLQESIDQDMAEPLSFVFSGLSLPLMELADSLLARTERFNPQSERVLEDILRAVVDLRRRQLHQHIDYLRSILTEVQENGDVKATQYYETMVQHVRMRERLDSAYGVYSNRAALTTKGAGETGAA